MNGPTRNYLYRRACADASGQKLRAYSTEPPTDVQMALLRCIAGAGPQTAACLAARSVVRACARRGWIYDTLGLTENGRMAIKD